MRIWMLEVTENCQDDGKCPRRNVRLMMVLLLDILINDD